MSDSQTERSSFVSGESRIRSIFYDDGLNKPYNVPLADLEAEQKVYKQKRELLARGHPAKDATGKRVKVKKEKDGKTVEVYEFTPLTDAEKAKLTAELAAWDASPRNAELADLLKSYRRGCLTKNALTNAVVYASCDVITNDLLVHAMDECLVNEDRIVSVKHLLSSTDKLSVLPLINKLGAWTDATAKHNVMLAEQAEARRSDC
jgi:hypothetical protein